jgi:hypothetical protein
MNLYSGELPFAATLARAQPWLRVSREGPGYRMDGRQAPVGAARGAFLIDRKTFVPVNIVWP